MAETTPAQEVSEETLKNWMARYQQADAEAADLLIRHVSPMLLRFISGPIYARNEAEDLVQECWLRIHRARHTYRVGEPVLPWFFAIARNTRVDALRHRIRIEAREVAMEGFHENTLSAPPPTEGPGPEFGQLLENLPESQREVILMLKVSGMTVEEVARATSSTVGAVKQKAHRAYEKLRRALGVNVVRGENS